MFRLCLSLLLVHTWTVSASPPQSVVRTEQGLVKGTFTKEALVFKGIRYAAPVERFSDPQPPLPWEGTKMADQWPPMCLQQPSNCETNIQEFNVCTDEVSEDCLFLNIFVPKSQPRKRHHHRRRKFPVIIYIHGGSHGYYSANGELWNGERFASRTGTIVVNINYRLGVMASFVNDFSTGNFALKDQRLAFEWVKRNIEAFGGDDDEITLMGHSSGGASIALHLQNQKSDHLFKRAILIEPALMNPLKTKEVAEQMTEAVAQELGCDASDRDCMSSVTGEQILEAERNIDLNSFLSTFQSGVPWIPYIDGDEVLFNLVPYYMSGFFPNSKDVITGSVAKGGTFFVLDLFPDPLPQPAYEMVLKQQMGDAVAAAILQLYPISDPSDCRDSLISFITDYLFVCPTTKLAENTGENTKSWLYNFNEPFGFLNGTSVDPIYVETAVHIAELPFVFQTADRNNLTFSKGEQRVSDDIMFSFAQFAKTGNPNTFWGPKWPTYRPSDTPENATKIFSSTSPGIISNPKAILCEMLYSTN